MFFFFSFVSVIKLILLQVNGVDVQPVETLESKVIVKDINAEGIKKRLYENVSAGSGTWKLK